MRVENSVARLYYLKESTEQNWSVRNLERNINTFYYQQILVTKQESNILTQNNVSDQAITDFIKDPYEFELLNLSKPINETERKIEQALIVNLQSFLLELAKGFSFVARQFRGHQLPVMLEVIAENSIV